METVGLGLCFEDLPWQADRPPRPAYAKKQGLFVPNPSNSLRKATDWREGGTEGSNPVCSSGESSANRFSANPAGTRFVRGTGGSNPSSPSGESIANLFELEELPSGSRMTIRLAPPGRTSNSATGVV
jgi:hypothetical protein